MDIADIILFPIYVWLFNLFFISRRKTIQDPLLQKYHQQAFWIKVGSCVAFCIFQLYISPGDSTALYFPEGKNISQLIIKDFSNIKFFYTPGKEFDDNLLHDSFNSGYLSLQSNYSIVLLVAFFSFFTFQKYVLINLIFSMISFSGVWKLFRFFYALYPQLHKKLAIAILYLPTFVFWSSGILKDPICTGMLGWLTFSLYELIFLRKNIIKNILIAAISGYILGVIKAYIILAYLPVFAFFIILVQFNKIKSIFSKLAFIGAIVGIGSIGLVFIYGMLNQQLSNFSVETLSESVKIQQSNYEKMADLAESSFTLGVEFDGSMSSLGKIAPAAVMATFFRPYLWESKKLSTLLSSLESLAMMLLTLYVFFKNGPFFFLKTIFKDPMVFFCFFYSVIFAIFVGATTLNFGTLVRYKIPCLPFYIIAMILINERGKMVKTEASLKKRIATS